MSAKTVLVFCAQILLFKSIYGQYANIPGGLAAEEFALVNSLAYGAGSFGAPVGYGNGFATPSCGGSVAPTSGGGFAVTSTSPISPTGITVVSENAIEGTLAVVGELPFLGAVALEGNLPTSGAGGINYGCGNGAVGIVSEGITPPAPAYPSGYGPGLPGGSYGPGFPGYGPRGY